MPFQYLIAPFVIWLAVIGWLWYDVDESWAPWAIPPALILAVLIVSRRQINWWYYNTYTPDLDAPIRRLLETSHVFYKRLFPNEQAEFRKRVLLYVVYHQIRGMGLDELPNDLRAAVAIKAVTVAFRTEDPLMKAYDPIFIYGHPFPTPKHNALHTLELDREDRAIILSAPQLMAGTLNPRSYYDTGLHAFAEAFRHAYPDHQYPELQPDDWHRLETIGGFVKHKVLAAIGLPENEVPLWPVAAVTWFHFPDAFLRQWPEMDVSMKKVFEN